MTLSLTRRVAELRTSAASHLQILLAFFSTYCKDLYKRCVLPKGVPTLGGKVFYYNDTYRCLRERCTNDPNFFDQMEEKVRSKHREALGNDVFDLEFVDWVAEVGIWRKRNPYYSLMTLKQRIAMTDGRTALHSEPTGSSSTMPLESHPHFQAMRAQTREPATSDKGKGKGKAKEKGKDKKRQRNEGAKW